MEKYVIVPYVLYGCKTLSILLRKLYIQTTFEKYGGEEYIGCRKEEVTYGRRMLNNKKLYDLSFCRQTNEEEENYIQDFGGKR